MEDYEEDDDDEEYGKLFFQSVITAVLVFLLLKLV